MPSLQLIRDAALPMLLLIGERGTAVANEPAMTLIFELAGVAEAVGPGAPVSATEILAPDYAQIWMHACDGQPSSLRKHAVRLFRGGAETTAWLNLDFVPVRDAAGAVVAVMEIISDITPHVRRAEECFASNEMARMSLEASDMVGIWSLDTRTSLCTSDATVANMFGLPVAECERGIDVRCFIDAIAAEDQPEVFRVLEAAIARNIPYRCRYRLASRDDESRWVIASGKPDYDGDGNLIGLRGIVVDISEAMTAVAALAESRFQFQTLTETLPQIVWSCDATGSHDYFSRRWCEFTGVSPESITEDTWKQLVYPDHWPMVSEVWSKAIETGEPYDLDYRFRHHSGEFRWLRVMALPMRDENGHIKRWFGTSTDVHDAYLLAEEREKLAREHERIATEDQLTLLRTRRAFFADAETAIRQARQSQRAVSLIMLDIDHFKRINDTYGHPGGDAVLAVAAQRLRGALKETDVVGRLGGEEFAVLLPDCDRRRARLVAERIRRAIASEPVRLDEVRKVPVTVSLGVTTAIAWDESLNALLLVADKALYEAKSAGRNRSVFCADPSCARAPV